jgi:formylglycine-generating enzyme
MFKTIALFVIAFVALSSALVPGAAAPSSQPATARSAIGPKELTLDLGDKVTLKLVEIPAGKFLMGSPETENGRNQDEVQHEVRISRPFYMGITHVTVDQFAAFVKDTGYKTDAEKAGNSCVVAIKDGKLDIQYLDGCSWRDPSFKQKGDHPVVQVSWNDARAFCDWLSKKNAKSVGLPTEAQWEYVCRAGTKTAYPWGDNPDDGKGWANLADQSLKRTLPNERPALEFFNWDDGFVFTSPVGSFKANGFGLYDMIGNAFQWCQDWYVDYEKRSVTDPAGVAPGDQHVLRGASWYNEPEDCRSAHRFRHFADDRSGSFGFRVVVTAGVN